MQSLVNYLLFTPFHLLLWPSLLDVFHLSLSPPCFTLLPTPKAHTHLLSQGLPSDVPPKGGCRVSGESRFQVFIPRTAPCWVAAGRLCPRAEGGWAAWRPSPHQLTLITVHSQVLTLARYGTIACALPAPCLISNAFIKLRSSDPI